MRLTVTVGFLLLGIACGRESRLQPSLDAGALPLDALCLDADGDGINGTGRCENERVIDCNDTNPFVFPGANEVCNGRDDSCEGLIDEGLPLLTYYIDSDGDGVGAGPVGQGCRAPDAGVVTVSGDCDDAQSSIRPGAAEICNGRDDDCDAQADNGIPVTDFFVDADNDGFGDVRGLAMASCQSSVTGRVANRGDCDDRNASVRPGAPETCNRLDDNCDGQVDNGLPVSAYYPDIDGDGFGSAVAAPETACAPVLGKVTSNSDCNDQQAGIRPGAVEMCNAIDDNCSGVVDEGFVGLGQACTAGVGACQRTDAATCSRDGLSVVCSAAPGVPTAERCNGFDDDCNGVTDEGFSVGQGCTAGIGACSRTGSSVCAANGTGTVCGAMPGSPVTEACNGVDDDCDGQTDEGLGVGASCVAGVGACARGGLFVCSANGSTTCNATPGSPAAELCNGLDDDCNGVVDNGFSLGQTCSTGVGACARNGIRVCTGSGAAGCDAVAGSPGIETCNGLDDDCDGSVDEGIAGVGQSCSAGVGGCVRTGVTVCSASGVGCSVTAGPPAAERCNGLDDDCDGAVDEDFSLGSSCSAGIGSCSRTGIFVCGASGAALCNATVGSPSAELCNGIDDDCDGTVDDGIAGVGQACTVGLGVCQRNGAMVCNSSGTPVCSVSPGAPTAPACDGLDNDCDGVADEPVLRGTAGMGSLGLSDVEVQPYYFTSTANGGCNGGAAANNLPDALAGGAVVMGGGAGGLWFQPLATDGAPSGPIRQITTLSYSEVSFAQAGQGFVVAGVYAQSGAEIDFYFVDPTGTLLATKFFGFRGSGSPAAAVDSLRLVRGGGKRVTLVWREVGSGIKLGRVEPCLNASTWEIAQPGCAALSATSGTAVLTGTSTATINAGLGADSNLPDWEPSQTCVALGSRRVGISYSVSFTGSSTVNEARLITVSESGVMPAAEVSVNALAPPSTFTDTDLSFYRSSNTDGWAMAYVKNGANDSDLLWWLSVNDNKHWPWLAVATQNGAASIARPRVTVTADRIWWAALRWVNDATSSKRQVMTRVTDLAGAKIPTGTAVEVPVTQGSCANDADCRPGDKGSFSTWAPFGRAYFSASGATPAGSFSSRLTCD
jgi:hypothetical protein